MRQNRTQSLAVLGDTVSIFKTLLTTVMKNLKRVMFRDGMCGASVEALKNRHFKLIHVGFSPFLAPKISSKLDKKYGS